MMWASLFKVKEGLQFLRQHMDGQEKENALLQIPVDDTTTVLGKLVSELQAHLHGNTNKATFDYNTVIISLYGYLEHFVEQLVSEYVEFVNGIIPSFIKLPPEVQKKHLEMTLKVLSKADQPKYAGKIRPEQMVANLHACFSAPDQYKLNVDAFTHHDANMRQGLVQELFAQCGIPNLSQHIRRSAQFRRFLLSEDPDRELEQYLAASDEIVFGRLSDLAERRNNVAHGEPVDEILSHSMLRPLIDFVESYCETLASVAYEHTLPQQAQYRSIELGNAIAVYNGRIVCVALPSGRIHEGDTLIAKSEESYRAGPIVQLQRDKVRYAQIDGGEGVLIGMEVTFGAKQNQEFFLLTSSRNTVNVVPEEVNLVNDTDDLPAVPEPN